VKTVVADRQSKQQPVLGELPFAPTIRLLFAYYSPFAIRRSLPFSVVADSLMADTKVCPYHSLFAIRYSLPFLPVANR
jgi:hypothetical protein